MNFKEIFEKYKSHTATTEEITFIEAEVEKNRLIIDYLNEQDDSDLIVGIDFDDENHAEMRKIKKSIRKKGIFLISVAVSIVMVLIFLYTFVVTSILNHAFYDPTKSSYSPYSTDFDVCMSAYSELHFPAYSIYNSSRIKNVGIGQYDINIIRDNRFTGEQDNFTMKLDKGILSVPDGFWAYPDGNSFTRGTYPFRETDKSAFSTTMDYLKELPDYLKVKATISFDHDLTMDELVDLVKEDYNIVWTGIRSSEVDTQVFPLVGFSPNGPIAVYEKINSFYSNFGMYSDADKAKVTGPLLETHFKSLLQFMSDHNNFIKSLELDSQRIKYYNSILDYVSKNGVKTYGVVIVGSPVQVLKFCESQPVEKVEVKAWFND